MSGIDVAEVRRVAELAGLELDASEARRLAGELEGILEHVARLPGAASDGDPGSRDAPEPYGAPARTRLRPDVPSSDPLAAGPERWAPDWRGGYFVVPRLPAMEGPDDGAP